MIDTDELALITPTAEQLATPHPYEAQIARRGAWVCEHVFTELLSRAEGGTPERGNMLFNFGQSSLNHGKQDLADTWRLFLCAKFYEEAVRIVALDIQPEEAEEQLRAYSGYFLTQNTAQRMLLKAAKRYTGAL